MKQSFNALSFASLVLLACCEAPGGDDETRDISVDEIGTSVTLVGRLGKPLGKMASVRGRWSYPEHAGKPAKGDTIRFKVTRVDNRAPDRPVAFDAGQIVVVDKSNRNVTPSRADLAKLDGVSWTLRAYETGRLLGTPADFWKEVTSGPPATRHWRPTFQTELVGVLQE